MGWKPLSRGVHEQSHGISRRHKKSDQELPPHTHTLLMSSITQRTSDLHCEALCHSKHLLFSFTLNGRHNYLEHAPLHLPRSILENLEVFRLFCDVLVGTNRRNISFLMPLCTNYSHWAAICWPANEIG